MSQRVLWVVSLVSLSVALACGNAPPQSSVVVPLPPGSVQAVAGALSAKVSWMQPVSNGGAAITAYTITPYVGTMPGRAIMVVAPATSANVTGLVAGTPYTFTVSATNRVGSGQASPPSSAVIPYTDVMASAANSTLTAAPNPVSADGTSAATLTVRVNDATGAPVPFFPVTLSASGAGAVLSPASGLSDAQGLLVAHLTSTTAGLVTVTATIGSGILSTGVNFTPGGLCTGMPLFGELPETFVSGQAATFVAQADLNGDGKLDLVVGRASPDGVSIFLGQGGVYGPESVLPVGTSPSAAVVADVNGDHRPDLVVANAGSNNVSVLLGNGDGTFQAATNVPVGTSPVALVVQDFTGDNKADVAVLNQGSLNVTLLQGDGAGGFTALGSGLTLSNLPAGLVSADFNGDTKPDLAVAENGGHNAAQVAIFLNKGSGSFGPETFASAGPLGNATNALAAADINGDLAPDLVVAGADSMGTPQLFSLLGRGDGTFQTPGATSVPTLAVSLALVDLNHDQRPDAIMTDSFDGTVQVLLGTGSGGFDAPASFPAGTSPAILSVGDINGDGNPDVVVSNANSPRVTSLMGFGDGTLEEPPTVSVDVQAVSLAVGDVDGDHRLDLVAVTQGTVGGTNDLDLLFGNGSGSFALTTANAGAGTPNQVAMADFNHDGKLDLVTANANDSASVLLNQDGRTFAGSVDLPLGHSGSAALVATAADLDGDGNPDFAVADNSSHAYVFLGDGDGGFRGPSSYWLTNGWFSNLTPAALTTGDFDGDGHLDLVLAHPKNNTFSVLMGQGDGGFQQPTYHASGKGPSAVATGDFNQDAWADVAVANADDGTVTLYLSQGDGGFGAAAATLKLQGAPSALISGDFNHDGLTDLAVAQGGSNAMTVFFGAGDAGFQPGVSYAVGSAPASLVNGDFNGDGRGDFAVLNGGTHDMTLLLNSLCAM